MRESPMNAKCVAWIKRQPGCWGFKVGAGPFQEAGLPDVVGCILGEFFGAEGKVPGKEPTTLQSKNLELIRRAYGHAFVYHSLAEFQKKACELKDIISS